MPPDKPEVENLFIIDPSTGKRTEINTIPTLTMTTDTETDHKPITSFTYPIEFKGTMENVKISKGLLELLVGKRLICSGILEEIKNKMKKELPQGAKIFHVSLTQNRTHKKYRINKKWAKRYGYTFVIYYE